MIASKTELVKQFTPFKPIPHRGLFHILRGETISYYVQEPTAGGHTNLLLDCCKDFFRKEYESTKHLINQNPGNEHEAVKFYDTLVVCSPATGKYYLPKNETDALVMLYKSYWADDETLEFPEEVYTKCDERIESLKNSQKILEKKALQRRLEDLGTR